MALNIEFSFFTYVFELIHRKTNIHLYNAVALSTGQMMMMIITADTIMMRSIGKLNTVQQTHTNELLYGTIHSSSTKTRFGLPHLLPDIINREIGSTNC